MWHWICYLQHERPCSIGYIQDRGEGEILYIRYNSMCSSLRRKRTNPGCIAQIRVLESRRVLHNMYLILIGVKLRSILDEFWLGVHSPQSSFTPNQNSSNIDLNFTPTSIKYRLWSTLRDSRTRIFGAISQTDITGFGSFTAQATCVPNACKRSYSYYTKDIKLFWLRKFSRLFFFREPLWK